ncbi:MAG: hypothetical protein ACYTHJ_19820 [Planctomycetota bacterium]|jgi:hypothetical protein
MKLNSAILATLTVILSASTAWGQAPYRFTYQGELTENDCLAEGVYAMDLSIWSDLTGGTEVLQVSYPDVTVANGRFTVEIPVGTDTFQSSVRYLELTVNGVTLSPRERITASPYSLQTRGLWVDESQNVGIKISDPEASLDVLGDSKLRGDVNIRERLGVGDPSQYFGQVTIADSGEGIPFAISAEWNNDSFPTIFASNAGTGGVLWAQGASDAAPDGGGLIVAGDLAGTNVAIDANEIMARDAGATAPLYLNHNGGDVIVGGTMDIGWVYVSEDIVNEFNYGRAYCPDGKKPLGGGCNALVGIEDIESDHPFCDEDGCGWSCAMTGTDGVRVHVICADIK